MSASQRQIQRIRRFAHVLPSLRTGLLRHLRSGLQWRYSRYGAAGIESMSEELLINVTPQETRVATVENGVLVEVCIERARRRGLVGNIYKGKVVRVLPGMEAAFVDVGLERAAFLHVSDVCGSLVRGENGERIQRPVQEMLREGQVLLAQVVKDPLGTKGARLTTHLTIPSRYLVFMPGETTIGISSRIENDAERERLRGIIQQQIEELGRDGGEQSQPVGGFILRTAAEGASDKALVRDMRFLLRLWQSVQLRMQKAEPGKPVHEDLPLVERTMRDLGIEGIERIRIDSRETYQRCQQFCSEFLPEMKQRISHYPGERPIFDLYNVEDEIQKALEKKVHLKSGGYLIIDQTESMTTIDVNTGAFVGHRNLEETIFKTNLEAAQGIARQLRLRNLGGIIILDFIDMTEDEHKRQVMRALEKALDRDHAKSQVCDVSALGLVEMTRKRTRESLEHVLCESCPTCAGRGKVKTAETVAFEITREIVRQVRQFDVGSLTVLAAPSVVDLMLDDESDNLAELEAFIGVPIRLQGEEMYAQEQYDVVLV
jgi:ribonuclease G